MDKLGILNIYRLNIYHTVILMFRIKNNTISEAFRTKFQIVQHNYAIFSALVFKTKPKKYLVKTEKPNKLPFIKTLIISRSI